LAKLCMEINMTFLNIVKKSEEENLTLGFPREYI
jgi:hypothetical protein